MKLVCQKRLFTISNLLALRLHLSAKMVNNATDNLVKERSVKMLKNALTTGKHALTENALIVAH